MYPSVNPIHKFKREILILGGADSNERFFRLCWELARLVSPHFGFVKTLNIIVSFFLHKNKQHLSLVFTQKKLTKLMVY